MFLAHISYVSWLEKHFWHIFWRVYKTYVRCLRGAMLAEIQRISFCYMRRIKVKRGIRLANWSICHYFNWIFQQDSDFTRISPLHFSDTINFHSGSRKKEKIQYFSEVKLGDVGIFWIYIIKKDRKILIGVFNYNTSQLFSIEVPWSYGTPMDVPWGSIVSK